MCGRSLNENSPVEGLNEGHHCMKQIIDISYLKFYMKRRDRPAYMLLLLLNVSFFLLTSFPPIHTSCSQHNACCTTVSR